MSKLIYSSFEELGHCEEPNTATLTVKVPPSVYRKYKEEAEKKGLTVSELLRGKIGEQR